MEKGKRGLTRILNAMEPDEMDSDSESERRPEILLPGDIETEEEGVRSSQLFGCLSLVFYGSVVSVRCCRTIGRVAFLSRKFSSSYRTGR